MKTQQQFLLFGLEGRRIREEEFVVERVFGSNALLRVKLQQAIEQVARFLSESDGRQ